MIFLWCTVLLCFAFYSPLEEPTLAYNCWMDPLLSRVSDCCMNSLSLISHCLFLYSNRSPPHLLLPLLFWGSQLLLSSIKVWCVICTSMSQMFVVFVPNRHTVQHWNHWWLTGFWQNYGLGDKNILVSFFRIQSSTKSFNLVGQWLSQFH